MIFIYLCDLIVLSGILFDIVYMIKLRYTNEPTIHCNDIMFSILSRKPNNSIFLRTIYPGYSNAFIKLIPNTPNVTSINDIDINDPII